MLLLSILRWLRDVILALGEEDEDDPDLDNDSYVALYMTHDHDKHDDGSETDSSHSVSQAWPPDWDSSKNQ